MDPATCTAVCYLTRRAVAPVAPAVFRPRSTRTASNFFQVPSYRVFGSTAPINNSRRGRPSRSHQMFPQSSDNRIAALRSMFERDNDFPDTAQRGNDEGSAFAGSSRTSSRSVVKANSASHDIQKDSASRGHYAEFDTCEDLRRSLYDIAALRNASSTTWTPPLLEDEMTPPVEFPEPRSPSAPSFGPEVPYRFRVTAKLDKPQSFGRNTSPELTYTDFAGLRYPTLQTAENCPNYWSSTGLSRMIPRDHKIHLPAQRRLSPYLREIIWFLHSLDPIRFSKARIAERYRLKEYTVDRVWHIVSNAQFLAQFRLTRAQRRRMTVAEAVMDAKEKAFATRCGYDPIGDQIGKRQFASPGISGGNTSYDPVLKQAIQVEAVSAFPLPSLRDPVKRKFDIDMEVKSTPRLRVFNWVDPTDKVSI